MIFPIKDNILIMALNGDDKWYGSSLIVRPDSTKDRANQGFVKSIGPNVQEVKVGDYVLFSPYAGIVVDDSSEGSKQIMLSEKGVVCILTPPNTTVQKCFIETTDGMIPATMEALMQLIRVEYNNIPRVAEQKLKFEQRESL